MSSIRVSGNTSGHYDLTVPDVAGSNTIALDKIVVADSNGFVGIGTTTAYSASTDFEVKATDPKIVINNTGQRAFGLLASGTKLHIRDESDNQDLVTITEGGNVGIGYTGPNEKLHVDGYIEASSGFKLASHPVLTYDGFDGGYATRLGSTGTSTLNATQIFAGGSVQATFKGGNVGIGTTNPTGKLHADGAIISTSLAQGSGELQIQGYGNTGYINMNGSGSLIFRMGSSYSQDLKLTSAGILQGVSDAEIKTSPIRKHSNTISTNTTIDSSENAIASGPISVATGVTLTINGNMTVV